MQILRIGAVIGPLLLALTAGSVWAQAEGKRVQCWTDSNGHRACGDSVPPQYAPQQRDIYDAQGRVREVKPREKTQAELEAEEKAKREKTEAALQAQRQRDYDRFLLETYSGGKDIEKARDDRLTQLDGRKKLVEKQLADNEKAIAQQQARVDNASKDGKTPPAALTKKLADLKQTRDGNKQSLLDIAADKQKTIDKYAADLARFRELRGDTTKPAAPANPAASTDKPATPPTKP